MTMISSYNPFRSDDPPNLIMDRLEDLVRRWEKNSGLHADRDAFICLHPAVMDALLREQNNRGSVFFPDKTLTDPMGFTALIRGIGIKVDANLPEGKMYVMRNMQKRKFASGSTAPFDLRVETITSVGPAPLPGSTILSPKMKEVLLHRFSDKLNSADCTIEQNFAARPESIIKIHHHPSKSIVTVTYQLLQEIIRSGYAHTMVFADILIESMNNQGIRSGSILWQDLEVTIDKEDVDRRIELYRNDEAVFYQAEKERPRDPEELEKLFDELSKI